MKATLEGELQANTDAKASTNKQLAATLEYIESLHGECDWLLKYYDARKEARTSEIESLGQSKAVLMGADYSLMQTKAQARRATNGFLARCVSLYRACTDERASPAATLRLQQLRRQ